jgi:hypothetical protein
MRISSATTQCVLCAALLWLGSAAGTRASIVVPDIKLFAVEDLHLDASASTEAGSSAEHSSPIRSSDKDDNGHAYERTLGQDAFSFGGTSTGTSSSSSSNGGSSNSFAVRSANANITTDPEVAGWLSGEGRFALPMPPVNPLLRPPQG